MSIYAISDLHLAFGTNKPMDIFGYNWENHAEKIKKDWLNKVKEEDLVLLPGDFSWAMNLEDTYEDFKFLNELPGKKLLLKGNHDYWWSTITKLRKYVEVNDFSTIEFLYNNSFEFENYIICGTRGWMHQENEENDKILKRENIRLELSLNDGIQKFGIDKEIIVCTHYPPFIKKNNGITEAVRIMLKYNVKKCLYGHLHGVAHADALQGNVLGIDFKLVSCDYTNFSLIRVT